MLKIGELAKRTNVSVDALRLYEKRGLIKSERMANGYRSFAPETDRLVNLVKLGQRLGFTLKEMAEIVGVLALGDLSPDQTAILLEEKLSEIDTKIAGLTELRQLLSTLRSQTCPLRASSTV